MRLGPATSYVPPPPALRRVALPPAKVSRKEFQMTTSNRLACTLTALPPLAHRGPRGASTSTQPSASSPRRRGRLGSGLWLGATLLVLLGRPAYAVDINSLPIAITQPGTYTMTVDIDYAGGSPAILIAANDVVLDLGGHTLSSNLRIGAIHLQGVSNVTVTNGVVSGFSEGVTLDGASGCTVTGLTARLNQGGINLRGGASGNTIQNNICDQNIFAGILLQNSGSLNILKGNTCTRGETYGISLVTSSNGNTLVENTASDNFTAGIRLENSEQNQLVSNTAERNNGRGIYLQGGSNGNDLRKNTVSNNGVGIHSEGVSATTLQMNTVNANNTYGIWMGGGLGHTLRDNTANGNSVGGILVEAGSGCLITKNTALTNGTDLWDTTCANTWKKNVFGTSSGACIQ